MVPARALQGKQTSVAEWVLLHELHQRGQAAPAELADHLGFTRGAISKIVDKLDAKGWIQTGAKEGDSRFRLLSLTRAGRRSLPVLAEIADQNDARYFDCLSAREKSTLRELLVKLAIQRFRVSGTLSNHLQERVWPSRSASCIVQSGVSIVFHLLFKP